MLVSSDEENTSHLSESSHHGMEGSSNYDVNEEMEWFRDWREEDDDGEESSYDDDDDDDEEGSDDLETLDLLPKFVKTFTKREELSFCVEFLKRNANISKIIDVAYEECLSRYLKIRGVHRRRGGRRITSSEDENEDDAFSDVDERSQRRLTALYRYLCSYFMENSANHPLFTKVFSYPMSESEGKGKTTLRHHLFLEICRLRFVVRNKYMLTEGWKYGAKNTKDLMSCGIVMKNRTKKPVYEESQRELVQDFYVMSKCWKTVQRTTPLTEYVDVLLDRMALFFCFSSDSDFMDDDRFRTEIPADLLFSAGRKEKEGYDGDAEEEEEEEELSLDSEEERERRTVKIYSEDCYDFSSSESNGFPFGAGGYEGRNARDRSVRLQYYPSMTFSELCQTHMKGFMGPLMIYENQKKYDLNHALNVCLKDLRKSCENDRIPLDTWFRSDMLQIWVDYNKINLVGEFKWDVADRYVYSSFSSAEEEWLKNHMNVTSASSSSTNNLSVLKECRKTEYEIVLKQSKTEVHSLMEECKNDSKRIGFYEWCVLKIVSRMFALQFSLTDSFVVNREDVHKKQLYLSASAKPMIVQYFSKYYLYYKGGLFVPEKAEPAGERVASPSHVKVHEETKDSVFSTVLLWIGIMLKDFPNHRYSVHVKKTMMAYLEQPKFDFTQTVLVTSKNKSNATSIANKTSGNVREMSLEEKRKMHTEKIMLGAGEADKKNYNHAVDVTAKKKRALFMI